MINPNNRMSRMLRTMTLLVFTALWLSGCVWLVLHWFFAVPGEFGTLQHPWEPTLLLMHGLIAVIALYVLGWLTARHVTEKWEQLRRRLSGITLLTLLLILSVSGFALFFLTDDRIRAWNGGLHEIVGVGIALFAVEHWFFGKPRRTG